MGDASPAAVRHVAALLQGGAAAFSLQRLVVLADLEDADADALYALADALPLTLHTLILDVRVSMDRDRDAAPATTEALRALLHAAATRCGGLRSFSLQLGTDHAGAEFVAACRAAVDGVTAARPDVCASYRAYTLGSTKTVGRKSTAARAPPALLWWQ
jgi:hypothetical protein